MCDDKRGKITRQIGRRRFRVPDGKRPCSIRSDRPDDRISRLCRGRVSLSVDGIQSVDIGKVGEGDLADKLRSAVAKLRRNRAVAEKLNAS